MRFLLAPAGSRGDFQPLLALAVGLRRAGHDVTLTSSPNFASEAAAFGVPFAPSGLDIEAFFRERPDLEMTPLVAAFELLRQARLWVAPAVDALLPLAREADVVVGAGAQIAAATAAEAAGVPYRFVGYTPQIFRSQHHMPFMVPLTSAPRPLNRLGWWAFLAGSKAAFGGRLDAKRRELGLPPLGDFERHFFPRDGAIVAADPELFHPPPDFDVEMTGALHLPDERPLGAALERFLDAGDAPVYVGFGSMPDPDRTSTTRHVVDAVRAAGRRLVLSAGWAGLGEGVDDPDAFVAGPVAHRKLFPRCAAIVHHGGAGTTLAAARAGVPQVVVPHAFDQIMHGEHVRRAGVGSRPLPRPKLTWRTLAARIEDALGKDDAARALGERLRARDGVANAIEVLTGSRAPHRRPRGAST